jgi:pimeloyl-ACP methyl ester carboxylesterase
MVTGCNDEPARVPPQQVAALAKQWRGEHPMFGGAFAQGLLLCGPWPVSAHPVGKPGGDRLPPVLVLSTANDPVTPEAGTKRAAQLLDSASLVSWAGSGHGALGQSECATTDAVKFLVDAQVPENNTVCPA